MNKLKDFLDKLKVFFGKKNRDTIKCAKLSMNVLKDTVKNDPNARTLIFEGDGINLSYRAHLILSLLLIQEEGVSEGRSSESSTRPKAVLVEDDCGSSVSSEVTAPNSLKETSSPRKPTEKQTPAQSVREELPGINTNHWFTMKDVKSQFVVAKPDLVWPLNFYLLAICKKK